MPRVIKSTEKTVITELGKQNRNNGIAPRDRLSTQLFNYFAQPPAQRAFCARANEIAQLVSSEPTAQVVAQAPSHLARLDQPFLDFYEAYAALSGRGCGLGRQICAGARRDHAGRADRDAGEASRIVDEDLTGRRSRQHCDKAANENIVGR